MQAVSHGRSRRFVDQALDFQPGKLGGKAGALALLVAEVSRHGNHRFADRAAEKSFGIGLERAEHQRRQFFGAEGLVTERDLFFAAHEAFEGGCGTLRVGGQARARSLADQDAAVFVEADHRRSEHVAEGIGNQLCPAILPDRHQAVGGTQVDTQHWRRGSACILHVRSLAQKWGWHGENSSVPAYWWILDEFQKQKKRP